MNFCYYISVVKGAKRATKSPRYFFILTRTTNSIFADHANIGRKNPQAHIVRYRLSPTFMQGLLQMFITSFLLLLFEAYFLKQMTFFRAT